MKIALIAVSHRDADKRWEGTAPALGTAVTALLSGLRLFPEHEVHVLMSMRRNPAPARKDGNITYHDVPVSSWGLMRSVHLGACLRIRRHIARIRPDIVHGQGTERECGLAAAFSGFPNVVTVHGNIRAIAPLLGGGPLTYNRLAARLEPVALAHTDGVICISDYTRRLVADHARRTWSIPNAVDEEFFGIRYDPGSTDVLVVGNIDVRKNQNHFIRSLDATGIPEGVRIVFAGMCPDSAYGREFRELVRLNPRCRYDGVISREELRNRMERTAIVALPTREDNCPMIVLEAMAAGIPVVASRVGGIPELVRDGETGALLDPDDSAGFQRTILAWLANTGLRARMGIAARQEAQKRFHPRVVAEAHLKAYSDLLGHRDDPKRGAKQ